MSLNLVLWLIVIVAASIFLLRQHHVRQRARDIQIAISFGRVLQRDPAPFLYDVGRLAHPKANVRAALLRLLVEPPGRELAEATEAALLALARYQAGVGEAPVDPSAATARDIAARSRGEADDVQRLLNRAKAVGMKRALREVASRRSSGSAR